MFWIFLGWIRNCFCLVNFVQKWKRLNLKPNIRYLVILDWNSKSLLSYLQSAPLNLPKKEFLTHTVNFGIGSVFSEDLGVLYKVCHHREHPDSLKRLQICCRSLCRSQKKLLIQLTMIYSLKAGTLWC